MKKSISSLNLLKTKAFLGIDFGKAKIGLAIADEETRMAFAFDTLKNNGDFLKNLKEIIKNENVRTIIIGIPEYKTENRETLKFGEKIEKEFNIKVIYQNEMFTTKMAQENIKKRGEKNISKRDDQEAARIILQSWLDRDI